MENKTNQIIVLDNSKEYLVLRQAIYKKETYYVTSLLINGGEDFEKESTLLKLTEENGKEYVSVVTDPEIIKIIMDHIE